MRNVAPDGWRYSVVLIPIKLHGRIKVDAWRQGLTMNEKLCRILWKDYFKGKFPVKPDRRR